MLGQPVILLGVFDEFYGELEKTDRHNSRWDFSFSSELYLREDLADAERQRK